MERRQQDTITLELTSSVMSWHSGITFSFPTSWYAILAEVSMATIVDEKVKMSYLADDTHLLLSRAHSTPKSEVRRKF